MSLPPLSAEFHVEPADYTRDLDALRAVREPVFVVEQHVPLDEEWDDLDPLSQHVLARDAAGRPIGTGRLTPQHKVGRMAVLKDWRGRGVGAAILQALLDRARDLGYPSLTLHAQTHALGFYAGFGFEPFGEEFDEAGIRHRAMRLELAPRSALARPAPPPPPAGGEVRLSTADDTRRLTTALVAQARRRLWIHTRTLEPEIYGDPAVLEALRRFATAGDGVEVRVLVLEPGALVEAHHPLLPLAQRLSSVFQFRTPLEVADRQFEGDALLDDRGGWLLRPKAERWDGLADTHAPGRHRTLLDDVQRRWDRAAPASALRALAL